MSKVLEQAEVLASLGWSVIPLQSGQKTPAIKQWPERATRDGETLRGWFSTNGANMGIATGAASGVWVLDIDVKGDARGAESLGELEAENGSLPVTVESRTATGGRHLFFRCPPGRDIGNRTAIRSGLDARGTGGYVVAPPSTVNGGCYEWVRGPDFHEPEFAPAWLLELVLPRQAVSERKRPPWEKVDPAPRPAVPAQQVASMGGATPIIERARLYLRECDPAIEHSGGHNSLLWAARALVVGFELSRSDALRLLWSEYNPRCSPPWDVNKPGHVQDFERKVDEALKTPGSKPRGWLLDDYGLRTFVGGDVELGRSIAESLLVGHASAAVPVSEYEPLPLDAFPGAVREIIEAVAAAHSVDHAAVALPVLAVAGAALGNAFRLRLKDGWDCPPLLWSSFVAETGSNKSGPLAAITKPMWEPLPTISENGGLMSSSSYQSHWIFSDATVEACIWLLSENPRGLLLSCDEMGGWLQSFDAYRSGKGGDEQQWIGFWDTKQLGKFRKTDKESTPVLAPAVSVCGAIQPDLLRRATSAEKLASGFFARALLAMPPARKRVWTDCGVSDALAGQWAGIVNAMRARPFAAVDANTGTFQPNIVELSPGAHAVWVDVYNSCADRVHESAGIERVICAKSDTQTARIGLVLWGLSCAVGQSGWDEPMPEDTMSAAVKLGQWFLDETVRVFETVCGVAVDSARRRLVQLIERKDGTITVRELQRANKKRYPAAEAARGALQDLAENSLGEWDGNTFTLAKTA